MRIFIADDSVAVRERLIQMLSEIEGIKIIGQAESALVASAEDSRKSDRHVHARQVWHGAVGAWGRR